MIEQLPTTGADANDAERRDVSPEVQRYLESVSEHHGAEMVLNLLSKLKKDPEELDRMFGAATQRYEQAGQRNQAVIAEIGGVPNLMDDGVLEQEFEGALEKGRQHALTALFK